MDLYESFFETCKADYETANSNQNKSRDYITLYHYQQSFEKGLKALHVFRFKQIKGNTYSDKDASDKIKKFSHNIENSYSNFVTEMAEFEKTIYNNFLNSTHDQREKNTLINAISSIDNFINSVNNLMIKLNLSKRFIVNINNYEDFIKKWYENYQTMSHNTSQTSSNYNFLSFILSSSILYPCLFGMDTITRYPDERFNYNNLEILKNQNKACKLIEEMISDFIVIETNILSNNI